MIGLGTATKIHDPSKDPKQGIYREIYKEHLYKHPVNNSDFILSGQFLINLCPRIKRDQSRNVIQALGFILPKFQPERSHGDPFYIDFYELCVFLVQVGDHLLGAEDASFICAVKLMVFCKSSFKMLILRCVFEGRCHDCM